MSYGKKPYPQCGGSTFIPYLSSLDCLANCGADAINFLSGSLVPWKDYIGFLG